MGHLPSACFALSLLLIPLAAAAQNSTQVGTLSCDVSRGIGLFVVEKQKLACVFKDQSGNAENYAGSIDQFGVELGEVKDGHLIWGVAAATSGLPAGALAGSYTGVGANASFGAGAGANILIGVNDRSLSLQLCRRSARHQHRGWCHHRHVDGGGLRNDCMLEREG